MSTTMTINTIARGPVEVRYRIPFGKECLTIVDKNPFLSGDLLPDECPEGEYERVIEAFRASPEGGKLWREFKTEKVKEKLYRVGAYGIVAAVSFVVLKVVFTVLFVDSETRRLREEQYESRFLGRTPSLDRIECVGGIAYIHTASGGLLVGGQDIYAPVLTGDGKPMTCEEYQARFPRKKE